MVASVFTSLLPSLFTVSYAAMLLLSCPNIPRNLQPNIKQAEDPIFDKQLDTAASTMHHHICCRTHSGFCSTKRVCFSTYRCCSSIFILCFYIFVSYCIFSRQPWSSSFPACSNTNHFILFCFCVPRLKGLGYFCLVQLHGLRWRFSEHILF